MKVNYVVEDLDTYLEGRKHYSNWYVDKNLLKEEFHLSGCGKYKLKVGTYRTREGGWNISKGIVTLAKDDSFIVEVKRNYDEFPFLFFGDYFLCGEDYQGYSVINLVTHTSNVYLDVTEESPGGFCWSGILGVVNGNRLIVDGCYWGGSYDLVVYDFSNPEVLPLPKLKVMDSPEGKLTLEDGVVKATDSVEYRVSDGVEYFDLTDEEQDFLDKYPYLTDWKEVVKTIYLNL